MTTTQIEPRKRPPAFLYRYLFNPLFRGILGSPLHSVMSKSLLVLRFRGRKSGKNYAIPVAYVQDGARLLIATDSVWAKNLEGGAPVEVQLRGRWRRGQANVLRSAAVLQPAFDTMLRSAPMVGQIVGLRQESDGSVVEADVLAAQARGFGVVQVDLEGNA